MHQICIKKIWINKILSFNKEKKRILLESNIIIINNEKIKEL